VLLVREIIPIGWIRAVYRLPVDVRKIHLEISSERPFMGIHVSGHIIGLIIT
jgi:hypothetical protein